MSQVTNRYKYSKGKFISEIRQTIERSVRSVQFIRNPESGKVMQLSLVSLVSVASLVSLASLDAGSVVAAGWSILDTETKSQ